MKNALLRLSAVLLALLLLATASCSQQRRQDIPKNEDILAIVPFALDTRSVGLTTGVQGSVYVMGSATDAKTAA
jgi:hypothetical protein